MYTKQVQATAKDVRESHLHVYTIHTYKHAHTNIHTHTQTNIYTYLHVKQVGGIKDLRKMQEEVVTDENIYTYIRTHAQTCTHTIMYICIYTKIGG